MRWMTDNHGRSVLSLPSAARALALIAIGSVLGIGGYQFIAGRAGELPKRAALLVTATALSAAAMGIAAMRGEEPAG